ncbi:MAG: hypothetical protein WCS96_09250, partial [Victivallales bacterium]
LSSRIHKSDDVGRGGFGCRGLSAERRAYPKRYVPFRRQRPVSKAPGPEGMGQQHADLCRCSHQRHRIYEHDY